MKQFFRNKIDVILLIVSIISISMLIMPYISDAQAFPLSKPPVEIVSTQKLTGTPLFPTQCVDTMKVSRDKAKEHKSRKDQQAEIKKQVGIIASLGANCVVVATPYNEEFLPYLKLWIAEARARNLRVWFRGNFAEWEGWFGHKKTMTTDEHHARTKQFILSHPELFKDGDIFTSAPEAENGAPFSPIDTPQKYTAYRQFLQDQVRLSDEAFGEIGKDVTTNWLSMSGGVAKGLLTKEVLNQTGNIVTLDHYVQSVDEMEEYLMYFHKKYGSNLVVGEFGAPIPDINGKMDSKKQAEFVDELLNNLYTNSSFIDGVNYWTLSDSSTALVDAKGLEKPVVTSLKNYYLPAVISGTVQDAKGAPLRNITLQTEDGIRTVTTDKNGEFSLTVPAKPFKLIVKKNGKYGKVTIQLEPKQAEKTTILITLKPQKAPLLYRFKELLRSF